MIQHTPHNPRPKTDKTIANYNTEVQDHICLEIDVNRGAAKDEEATEAVASAAHGLSRAK